MKNDGFTVEREGWNFTIVHNDVIESDMSTVQKMVYVAICHFADSRGRNAFPSYTTIGKLAGCSRRAAISGVEKLVERGFIRKESRSTGEGQTSNVYTILSSRSEPIAPGGELSAPGVVNEVHRGSERGAPEREPSNESQSNEIREHRHKCGEYENVLLTDAERTKLIQKESDILTTAAIDYLSRYKVEKGYKTKSDYLTILRWVFDAVKEKRKKEGPAPLPYFDYTKDALHLMLEEAKAAQ